MITWLSGQCWEEGYVQPYSHIHVSPSSQIGSQVPYLKCIPSQPDAILTTLAGQSLPCPVHIVTVIGGYKHFFTPASVTALSTIPTTVDANPTVLAFRLAAFWTLPGPWPRVENRLVQMF
jgi:hypothetical protein